MYLALDRHRTIALDRPLIMGVLNVTPDSFSDGGAYADVDQAVIAAMKMLEQGADIIDVGGESTRPGALRVDRAEQIRRVVPVIEALVDRSSAIVSVDTTQAAVAEPAVQAGAAIVNDVSAGTDDPDMFGLVARLGTPLALMHMKGAPATMQNEPAYADVVSEVCAYLQARAQAAVDAGVDSSQIILDPGIGFGKTTAHNLQLLAHIDRLVDLGHPVLLGTSRKRFLGQLTGLEAPDRRDLATAITTAVGVRAGVKIFRVHDVPTNRQAADVTFAVEAHRKLDNT